MKKILCSAMILIALLVCAAAVADDIDVINSGRFPDPYFQQYILTLIPAGNDGFLTDEVIDSITEIDVSQSKVSNLKGIEVFRNLKILYCNNAELSGGLNVSGLTKLESLYCQCNKQLTSLNASGCSSLQRISAYLNSLESLNVTGCSSLQELSVFDNKLTSLDLSGCPALQELSVFDNKLTSLDLSGCPALQELSAYSNSLSGLEISKCPKLQIINVSSNHLSSISVSRCAASLLYLDVADNNLSSVNVSGCSSLIALWCYGNKIASLDITKAPVIKNVFRTGKLSDDEGYLHYYFTEPSNYAFEYALAVDKKTVVLANTVTFNANHGKGIMKALVEPNDKAFTLTANKFIRDGWVFASWNTKKDGSGTTYKNKASVTLKNKDLTLYAQWRKLKNISGIKLTFDSKNQIRISWNKLSSSARKDAKKIQIQISTDKNFRTLIADKKINSKETSIVMTIKKPKLNKTYYVRLRSYTKLNGVEYASKWSVKSKKLKK